MTGDIPGIMELWQQKPVTLGHVLWKELAGGEQEKVKAATTYIFSGKSIKDLEKN